MSAAKDKFYELMVPKIEALSFQFKKSKPAFIKIENDIEYKIGFHWDGRGGITILDTITVEITDLTIQKELKKQTGANGFAHIYTAYGYCAVNIVKIPVMYSRKTLDLANNMNFKALALMMQDEKYPPDRILDSANFVKDLIVNTIMPFFNTFKNSADIYNYLYERVEKETDVSHLTEIVKCYSETLGRPLPKKLD